MTNFVYTLDFRDYVNARHLKQAGKTFRDVEKNHYTKNHCTLVSQFDIWRQFIFVETFLKLEHPSLSPYIALYCNLPTYRKHYRLLYVYL